MATILPSLEAAYQQCEKLARTHYENFPVASLFLPSKIRRSIAVIYAFARQADDIADEGNLTPDIRLKQLQYYWQSLEDIAQKSPSKDPLFLALSDVLKQNPNLPITLFFDLLTAFKQDVIKNEYADFQEILNYCHYSANPVGRLLLYLTNTATKENLKHSDAVCTALQLINFLQDLQKDLTERNRCYFPQDEMRQYQVTTEMLKANHQTKAIRDFITTQLDRAELLLDSGSKLGKRLTGMFGFEVRLIIVSGKKIIHFLRHRKNIYDRPTLKPWHWPKLLWGSLIG